MSNSTETSQALHDITFRISEAGLVAVLVIANPQHAKPLLSRLVENGINTVEVAWRTPNFLPMLKEIRRAFPQLFLGVGTVLTPDQAKAAFDAGADFGLSPGISRNVVEAAASLNWPFVPGVMTPSDIQQAIELNCRLLKFFPAETAGGVAHLRTMIAPFLHLDLRFIVLGGINRQNMATYSREPSVAAIGGSWIASASRIENEDWTAIGADARATVDLIREARLKN